MKKPQNKTGLTTGSTYPLKDGEGAIYIDNGYNEEHNQYYQVYEAYGNNRITLYQYSDSDEGKFIIVHVFPALVDRKNKNYTFYQAEDSVLDASESYFWFDSKDLVEEECPLKPGKYTAKEEKGMCGAFGFYTYNDAYIFKKSADSKIAYNSGNKDEVSPDYVSEENYTVKSYSEIDEIMNSYPQSSSVIIPSIMIVLVLIFLFL